MRQEISIATIPDTQRAAYKSIEPMVREYAQRFSAEAQGLTQLRAQLAAGNANMLERSTMAGHVTTSMLVVDVKARKVLLIAHGIYRDWMPPGGHFEGDLSLWLSAAREVLEETGIVVHALDWDGFVGTEMPVDIDTHPIPENPKKGEGDHFHHDFTFLAAGDSNTPLTPQIAEVDDVKWRPVEDLRASPLERVRRLGTKLEVLLSTF